MTVRQLEAALDSRESTEWQHFLTIRAERLDDERKKRQYDRQHGFD